MNVAYNVHTQRTSLEYRATLNPATRTTLASPFFRCYTCLPCFLRPLITDHFRMSTSSCDAPSSPSMRLLFQPTDRAQPISRGPLSGTRFSVERARAPRTGYGIDEYQGTGYLSGTSRGLIGPPSWRDGYGTAQEMFFFARCCQNNFEILRLSLFEN